MGKSARKEPSLLRVNPSELQFNGDLNKTIITDLEMQNLSSTETLSFKVLTNTPHRYTAKPNNAVLKPNQKLVVQVHLLPGDNENFRDHRLLIQSIILPPEVNQQSIDKYWRSKPSNEIMENKLCCNYLSQIHQRPQLEEKNIQNKYSNLLTNQSNDTKVNKDASDVKVVKTQTKNMIISVIILVVGCILARFFNFI